MHPLLLLPLLLLLVSAAAEVPHKEPAVNYLSQLLGTHGQDGSFQYQLLSKLLASEGEGGPDVKDHEELFPQLLIRETENGLGDSYQELLLSRLLAMSQLDQQLLGLLSDRKEFAF
jgi:hypothetical protein